MKKLILVVAVLFVGIGKAQLVDEQNVTITMDLQPILQLEMNGSPNIDFVFDDIADYMGGIIKYGGTQLKVSSTVAWDLYAVGTSANAATLDWDNQVTYGNVAGATAVTALPLEALELHQDKDNPATVGVVTTADYFANFGTNPVTSGANNIYASATPYTRPAAAEKYIAGHNTAANFVAGGSYLLLNGGSVGASSNYWYSIDYRLVPGLPAVFPNAATNAGVTQALAGGNYAKPGVYTMNVKYVLVEN